MTPRPVIVDCDNALGVPGCDVDDGLALLFLLAQPAFVLRGVSTCFGNAPLPLVLRATRRLLLGHGVAVLAGVSAPTVLALQVAEAAGITVVGIARRDGFEVFTHPWRIEEA